MKLQIIRVTAGLRRRFEHVYRAEGMYPIDVAKVALADELIAAVQEQASDRLARLPRLPRSAARLGGVHRER